MVVRKSKKLGLSIGIQPVITDPQAALLKKTKPSIKGMYQSIPKALIERDPTQPRTAFDPNALAELMRSLETQQGNFEPIKVYANEKGTKYRLLYGERRWRAALESKVITHLDALVVDGEQRERYLNDPLGRKIVQILENEQKDKLKPHELAAQYREMADDYGLSHAQIAKALSHSKSHVQMYLKLSELPQDMFDKLSAMGIRDIVILRSLTTLYQTDADQAHAYIDQLDTDQPVVALRKATAEKVAATKAGRDKPKTKPSGGSVKQLGQRYGRFKKGFWVSAEQLDFDDHRKAQLEHHLNEIEKLLDEIQND